MESRASQRKSERIEEVVALLREFGDPRERRAAETFVRAFFRGVPTADLLADSPGTLRHAALSLWEFAARRPAGAPSLRLTPPGPRASGWDCPHTVLELVHDDMPFLVDSVTAELQRRGAEVLLIVHPIVDVARDGEGRRTAFGDVARESPGARRESWMQLRLRAPAEPSPGKLAKALERVLADVRAAVEDWKPCVERGRALAAELDSPPPGTDPEDVAEAAEFLRWLADDHFTFLGYREYAFEGDGERTVGSVVPGSGLGLLRDPEARIFSGLLGGGRLPADVRHFLGERQILRVTKANRRSTVHRPVLLDTIAVKRIDAEGRVSGGRVLVGLFTSRAYARSPREIPLLRRKVERAVALAGVEGATHDGKALLHILTTYPRDELFQTAADELCRTALGILDLQERPRVALFARVDPFERFVSCIVFVPRDRLDTALRVRFQDQLTRAWRGRLGAFYTHVGDSPLARLRFYIHTEPGKMPVVDVDALERGLVEAARSWSDRLDHALRAAHGEPEGLRLLARYGDAFPASYADHFDEHDAVSDIRRVERALVRRDLALHLAPPRPGMDLDAVFKLYSCGAPIPLSDVLPMLEHMGFRVRGELPVRLRPDGVDVPVWIREFHLEAADEGAIDLGQVRERFHEAFAQVWRGELESDGLNRLVLRSGLSAREVVVLRAYDKFLRQARSPFSHAYVAQTLAGRPGITRRLVELFRTRFDPARDAGADAREAELADEIEAELEQVTNLDQDRIFRRFLELIRATLRTNWFRTGPDGAPRPWLSLKLDSARIGYLPKPRPYREIFVYGPRMEAVHLRGGPVARGGLRWSDRLEDFRTEVLGLMKAQMVKNAVIVPVGSKGGFVCKRLPAPAAGREALMEEVVACYRTMIRGLLDLTDNLVDGAVVPPPDVVRHDGDDPYLVVAADKGTATFSDLANGVSAEYGFWLDDAFASGGSAGYDHKKMGITARGAWECVERHFRELGKDIREEPFTVAGVGDMAGDVFGNGMLLSRKIRLVAAFNHQHVFVDPDPDPETSWRERKRLFELPRSTWADYDASLLSEGGGIWERASKSVPVSPRMRELFRLATDRVPPGDLIHAILQADVELMWFGGIGTYVRASTESDADAGDRANDAVRIDATMLRARVVGEGANLALTQRGRIEAARRGVHLNTDALDNSAGVDCSDHEVNIKILLGERERTGGMSRAERDRLLVAMTDDVAELVLRDNYLQSQAVTVARQKGASLIDRHGRFMRALEKEGRLDRALEFLPDDEELEERRKARIGLTRPELAVLLSYAKIVLFDELVASGFPDDPWMADELVRYFPRALHGEGAERIAGHRLRREIVATMATNGMLNRVGISFLHEMKDQTGLPAEEIARAYIVTRDVFGLRELWEAIEALDNRAPASLQAAMLADCSRLVEHVVAWLLRELPRPLAVPDLVEEHRAGVEEIAVRLDELLPAPDRAELDRRTRARTDEGAPEELARRVAGLEPLAPACDVVRIAGRAGLPVARAGEVYFAVGDRFGFEWLRRVAAGLPTDTAWDKQAVGTLVDDLYVHQGALAARVLADARPDEPAGDAITRWEEHRGPLVARTRRLLAELETAPHPDLAMLAVATRQLDLCATC